MPNKMSTLPEGWCGVLGGSYPVVDDQKIGISSGPKKDEKPAHTSASTDRILSCLAPKGDPL